MLKVKTIPAAFVFLIFCCVAAPVLAATGFDVTAQSAILLEAATGQVLFEKNADTPLPPASITKLMTLILAFEALEKGQVAWDEPVPVSEEAWRMGGSQMFLEIGQEVAFGDLITGISVISANDATVAIAEHLSGSEAAFTQQMNQKAAELGLTNSHFKNTNGLPAPGHVMSARDIATVAHYLITSYPKILEIESLREFTFNDIRQFNRNPLLGRYPGADGLKTGWTTEAGYCLVGTAERDGVRLIAVILNTASEQERFEAAQKLLDHGFNDFTLKVIAEANQVLGEQAVKDGKQKVVPVAPPDQLALYVPLGREDDLELKVHAAEPPVAPVAAGTPVTTMDVLLDGEKIATVELVAAEDVKRANWLVRLLRSIGALFSKIRNYF